MRRFWLLLVTLMGLVGLCGCGPTMKSEHMKELEVARVEKYKECVSARKEAEAARLAAIARLTPEQTSMVMMGDAMARQAEALSGKDPCNQGMNAFEMETAIARSRNETIGTLGGTAIRTTGIGYGAYVAGDTLKSIAKTSGDKIEASEGSTVTVEKTTSNTDIKASSGDESGAVTVSGPTTTGPDKHSETTTEMLAPEAAVPDAAE